MKVRCKIERVLRPGEIACLKATVKLTWEHPEPFFVLETNAQAEAAEIAMVPKLVYTKALFRRGKKVSISLRNFTNHPVVLGT